jgi:hypothetical protein
MRGKAATSILLVAYSLAFSTAQAAEAWRLSHGGDKLAGQTTVEAVADVTSDDRHVFRLTASCVSGGLIFTILSTGSGGEFKQVPTQTQMVVVTRTRLDQGDIHNAMSAVSYNNEAEVMFLDMDAAAASVGSAYGGGVDRTVRDSGLGPPPGDGSSDGAANAFGGLVALLARPTLAAMEGGSLQDLKHASVLKMEATLKDGEQPLITIDLQGAIKRFIDAC